MKEFFATLHKEFLIFSRDRTGLGIVFLMPVVLVLVVSLVQEGTWVAITAQNMEVLVVDDDRGFLGNAVVQGLADSGLCRVVTEISGKSITMGEARKSIMSGRYKFAVIVPAGSTRLVRDRVKKTMALLFSGKRGAHPHDIAGKGEAARVTLMLAPDLTSLFQEALIANIRLLLRGVEMAVLQEEVMTRVAGFSSWKTGVASKPDEGKAKAGLALPKQGLVRLGLEYPRKESNIVPSSVQQNVPAWSLFGMFFILIPMAGSIITERMQGTLVRLYTTPAPISAVFGGKIAMYTAVCCVQFCLMLGIGLFILPLLGLPRLVITGGAAAIPLVVFAAALAAVGFGLLMGCIFSSLMKAAMFGAVCIVIFAALGGIMVPVFVMPKMLKMISNISPLAWAQNAFTEIFARGGGLPDVWVEICALLFFSLASLLAAWIIERGKARNGFRAL
ncbi:MAG: ABC transporter permease [Desulfobacteraceae bacterium]|jgi:ABC-2 type transport system permease protein|nr:ABC transporter permease [Desulfobacteraceae bacterium]